MCVCIYTCIYIYNTRFIISLHNLSFSPKSTEQNSFLIAMEAGGREGSSRAGRHIRGCCFLLRYAAAHGDTQQVALQWRGSITTQP